MLESLNEIALHLISQAVWNRCNLSIYLLIFGSHLLISQAGWNRCDLTLFCSILFLLRGCSSSSPALPLVLSPSSSPACSHLDQPCVAGYVLYFSLCLSVPVLLLSSVPSPSLAPSPRSAPAAQPPALRGAVGRHCRPRAPPPPPSCCTLLHAAKGDVAGGQSAAGSGRAQPSRRTWSGQSEAPLVMA